MSGRTHNTPILPAMSTTGNCAFHIQPIRRQKPACRTCGKPYIGTPTQKTCDECKRRPKR